MKIKHIIIAYSSIIAFASCNYLDYDETNGLNTREDIYRYFDKTKQMLTHVYTFMPQDFGVIGGAMRDCASDDAEFGATGGNIQDMTMKVHAISRTSCHKHRLRQCPSRF